MRGIRDYSHYVGDPAEMVDAMIASVDQQPAPRSLVLGSDSYKFIRRALDAAGGEVPLSGAPPGAYDVVTIV